MLESLVHHVRKDGTVLSKTVRRVMDQDGVWQLPDRHRLESAVFDGPPGLSEPCDATAAHTTTVVVFERREVWRGKRVAAEAYFEKGCDDDVVHDYWANRFDDYQDPRKTETG